MSPIYDFRKILEKYFAILLILIAFIYGCYRAYPLISGPEIIINSPKEGETVASSTFKISGYVIRAKEITLQGHPITIDDKGFFSETLVPYSPYTIIVMTAKDGYGTSIVKTMRVIPEK